MDLGTAIKRVRAKRISGGILILLGLLLLVTGGLKGLYFVLTSDATITSKLSIGIASLIQKLYQHTQSIDWIWRLAPAPNSRQLNSAGNFGFVFCMAVLFVGRSLWDSASSLQKAIMKAKDEAQRKKWERELGQREVAAQRDLRMNVVVKSMPEDEWYKKPFGIIVLGIAVATLGQWINLALGLAKV